MLLIVASLLHFLYKVVSDSFFDVVMVPFVAAAGNHFADEAGEEELGSQDDGYKCQVEERLVGNRPVQQVMGLADKFCDDQPEGDDAADQEHQDTCESEEVHRLFPEGAQKPQGKQVEESVDETFETEFAFSVFPFLVVNRFFCNL